MFAKHGDFIIRVWPGVLVAWIGTLIVAAMLAPPLERVAETEEFAFLPTDSPSHVAERLFRQAFPKKLVPSRVVIVVRRNQPEGLQKRDKQWIERDKDDAEDGKGDADPDRQFELRERLLRIAEKAGGLAESVDGEDPAAADATKEKKPGRSSISAIRTYQDRTLGRLLLSEDGKATLVLVELTTEFMDSHNQSTVKAIEELFNDHEFRSHIPPGLELSLSGEATVGRDMQVAAKKSAEATEHLTVVLVVILLIAIYRAPLLALIPLITVGVSVKLTMSLLILMAERNWIRLFTGVESYVTVLLYGAGVDYCLFLIARYKEELDGGVSFSEGVTNSLARVGAAIAASAGTVICGIGMMMFAEFGKFRQAGFAISFGLVIVLLASLTFTPALLRLFGSWAFYPQMRTERRSNSGGWLPTATLASRLGDVRWLENFWESVGRILLRRPMTVWLLSIGLMLPFAVVGVTFFTHLSYGLLSDLPTNSSSVIGTKAVQDHFPAGATGPITMLLQNENFDFSDAHAAGGMDLIRSLTAELSKRRQELLLSDIRSVSHPYGGQESIDDIVSKTKNRIERKVTRDRIIEHYVSQQKDVAGHVARMELTATLDPFSRDSIKHVSMIQLEFGKLLKKYVSDRTQFQKQLGELLKQDAGNGAKLSQGIGELLKKYENDATQSQRELGEIISRHAADEPQLRQEIGSYLSSAGDGTTLLREIKEVLKQPLELTKFERQLGEILLKHVDSETKILVTGSTASIRDLKTVTDGDQVRIDLLVITSVFLILVLLLRRPAICLYLIVTVLFSYLVALGATYVFYWAIDPVNFAGLDWKVPMFLFTILIAVGEDYNIFLMTRIEEEQKLYGPVDGVIHALQKTGRIISSCGIIMAGTFCSLAAGSLRGMCQLGFALAFGVLLDTFVVRPILVPAYLVLLNSGRFGRFSALLGADPSVTSGKQPPNSDPKAEPSGSIEKA